MVVSGAAPLDLNSAPAVPVANPRTPAMLFWADTMHVTVQGSKRAVDGMIKKSPIGMPKSAITIVKKKPIGTPESAITIKKKPTSKPKSAIKIKKKPIGKPKSAITIKKKKKPISVHVGSGGGSGGHGPGKGGGGFRLGKLRGTLFDCPLTMPSELALRAPFLDFPFTMTSELALKVGSDCSGWASEVHALHLLGLGDNIDHAFACDIEPASKSFISQNCRPSKWYDNCLTRDNSAKGTPIVNIYVAGFPCQPFSAAGKNKGASDKRADVFAGVFSYIDHRRPTIFVLENVKNLLSKTHKSTFDRILQQLVSLKDSRGQPMYIVHWAIWNSADFGVPQHRDRVYFVGIRKSTILQSMIKTNFSKLVSSCKRPAPPIHEFLGDYRMDRKLVENAIKLDISQFSKTAAVNLGMAMREVRDAKFDPSTTDIIVDLGNGRGKLNMVYNICPTITRTRGGRSDFYLISRADRLYAPDMFKLQGLDITKLDVTGISSTALGQLAGNAMTIPVLAAILRAALLMTGLASDV
jgi:DNA (cytosine-5)-methyltransferase 1